MIALVDTNIVLDVVTNDRDWAEWSKSEIQRAGERGIVAINQIVYAELSVFFDTTKEVDQVLADSGIIVADMPRHALFLAGKAFRAYRLRGGPRTGVLPDFFIGAHAAAAGVPLLTRDTQRYRTYFPDLHLITPHQ